MSPDVVYSSLIENSSAVAQVVLIAMLLERLLAFIFEWHPIAEFTKKRDGWKAPFAYAMSFLVCRAYDLDVMAAIFREEGAPIASTWLGHALTAGIVAGGSSGAIVLFQGWLKWGRDSRKAIIEAKQEHEKAAVIEGRARQANAVADAAAALGRKVEQVTRVRSRLHDASGSDRERLESELRALLGPAPDETGARRALPSNDQRQ